MILALIFNINTKIISSSQGRIAEDGSSLSGYDCILILGAGVYSDGTPTPMLADRLDCGIQLFNLGVSDTVFLTGDSVLPEYDEIGSMFNYAVNHNIPEGSILSDKYGISTYDSLYRAKNNYGFAKIVVVTQKYHLYRALYLADALGIDAVGICAEDVRYSFQSARDIRELLANVKAYAFSYLKPMPKYFN